MMTKRARLNIGGAKWERTRERLLQSHSTAQCFAESRASFTKGCRTKACELSVCAGEYACARRQRGGKAQSHGLLTQRRTATLNKKTRRFASAASSPALTFRCRFLFEKELAYLSNCHSSQILKGLTKPKSLENNQA